jgi:hypothetical protein
MGNSVHNLNTISKTEKEFFFKRTVITKDILNKKD